MKERLVHDDGILENADLASLELQTIQGSVLVD